MSILVSLLDNLPENSEGKPRNKLSYMSFFLAFVMEVCILIFRISLRARKYLMLIFSSGVSNVFFTTSWFSGKYTTRNIYNYCNPSISLALFSTQHHSFNAESPYFTGICSWGYKQHFQCFCGRVFRLSFDIMPDILLSPKSLASLKALSSRHKQC